MVMELLPAGEPAALHIRKHSRISLQSPNDPPVPTRAAWVDDGSDDRGSHVLPDLHLQQRQHYFHHGCVEDVPISVNRVGANGGGEVSQRVRPLQKK